MEVLVLFQGVFVSGAYFATAVVEPHNTDLRVHSSLEHKGLTAMMDNDALYSTCHGNTDIELNRLRAQVFSH